jgi:cyclopropane-fatty-acyl-phospholipid synthase
MILGLYTNKRSSSSHSTGHVFIPYSEGFVTESPAAALTLEILDKLAAGTRFQDFNIRLWNGEYWPDSSPKPATLVLTRPSALRELLMGCSEVAAGEAYLHGAVDIEGDIVKIFELADFLCESTAGWTRSLAIANLLFRLPVPDKYQTVRRAVLNGAKNSPNRDKKAVRFHYDVSNDFYSLWLDPRMVYSCAYFRSPETDLATAQVEKFDLICRKLELRPNERLLDIGSGWGGLLVHAATHYGVKAEGVTLSQNQFNWTQESIRKQGLENRISVRLLDYREMKEQGIYDKAVSVGMVEHVGHQNLGRYFSQVSELLKPGGLFLNHGIGLGAVPRQNKGDSFIEHYVFPDSDLPPISQVLEAAEEAKWEVRDVESLREHYALTLRHWVRNLEAHHQEALRTVDETAYRIWRLYMAGSAYGFDRAHLSIYQTLLAKPTPGGNSVAPMTREGWYRPK